ncbi:MULTISPECIES: LLM class flavin-dependent oxidoreductase [Microbispora]|uniref:LLM class flavin-dependent oxidoreductase n=3 Tax=Microbispora TaxID=2005 RepID=A0ABY3LP42_9ACTN|nr:MULTISPECIES: LLM class flavin-dependent oxidoreductase [Microbispora]GLW22708.1 luciferase [Microbispora amethystogenes]MBO4274151.1 LLM class flavin-dependent oxidoreductase [Microbispora triticiradicis]RGA00935.1 LLM class flavin-dependent oxidoreductase [Microbispora triticiradicis]TLP52519.1 LLM class flavin-dependent oxidoreductase [Microbispora fusca]TYB44482.1 LLM class flavin-dependent oxidoreductase [Microbispora tritici]
MRFGLFYHHQVPKPWTEDSEERVLKESLEQIELADRLGYDYVWETEHHFMEEYSHSAAPEVFLAAAAARTKNIRLAHGIVSIPPNVNHPVRVAERLATLDLISGGRVDFGSGQGSTQLEVGAFDVERDKKREQWREAIDVITRMLTEVPFTGHQGQWINVPPRNVVPKPKQKPHPPLWVACSSPETVEYAARNGMGALSFAFVSPEEAKERVETYYDLIASEECVPAGYAVNPNFALVMPFMCHEDEETALDRGVHGAHFFAYSFLHYWMHGAHRPGATDIAKDFAENRDAFGFSRHLPPETRAEMDPDLLARIDNLRKAIGTPDQLRELVRSYEAVGVDQIIFQVQIGANKHEHICESLELFAREVMPEFAERREELDAAKAARLEVPIKDALSRHQPATVDVSHVVISAEQAEMLENTDDEDD